MKHSKDQKLSTLNLATLKFIQNFTVPFLVPNYLFYKNILKNLNFEISCKGTHLAGFQKPLFRTPDITLQPSPVSVFCVIFVKLKMASSEPSLK
jgi:hypothetical protein